MAKEESFFDYVLAPFKEWYGYIKDNAVRYYVQLLKIYLLRGFVWLGIMLFFGLVAIGILAAVGGMGIFSDTGLVVKTLTMLPVIISLGLLFIIALIVAGWASTSVSLTAVIYTDSEFKKEKFSIMEAFNRIKGKVFRYLVAYFVIWCAIMLPVIIIILIAIGGFAALLSQGSETGVAILGMLIAMPLAMILMTGYVVIAQLLLGLFAQFWTYGFLLAGMGVRDALGRSVDMVLKKPGRVIVFGIMVYIGSMAFGAPLMIYNMFFQVIVRVLPYMALEYSPWMLWLVIVAVPVHILIVIVLSAIVQCFSLPSHYLFWKKVRKDTV